MNIYIWGAGRKLSIVYTAICKERCRVLGIIDSNPKIQNKLWNECVPIFAPTVLENARYDYIIISPLDYMSIREQIISLGVSREKIVCFWEDERSFPQLFNYLSVIKTLDKQKNIYENRYKNAPYEMMQGKSPKIISSKKTLEIILAFKKSLVRFGDGEWDLIFKRKRSWFQTVDIELSNRLKEIMLSNDDNIALAIADNFSSLDKYTVDAADGIREYMVKSRNEIEALLDYDREYFNSYVTRPYIIYKNKDCAIEVFDLFKQIVSDRDIIIVEGYDSNIGCGNDLFAKARSVRRVLCPQKDAWDSYGNILKAVIRYAEKQDLICISLGPTATVLAYDLAKKGFQALDVGQIDNEYEWFIRKVQERTDISGKFVAEIQTSCCAEYIDYVGDFRDKCVLEVINK